MNKVIATIIIVILVILIGIGVGLVIWWQQNVQPVDTENTEKIAVVITEGDGATDIAQTLAKKKLIRSDLRFRLYVKQHNLGSQLKPGRYQFSPSQSLPEIVELLEKGVVDDFWVTIPEGKRREEIAKILADEYVTNGANFSIADFLDATDGKEGYLFPDTYLIPKAYDAAMIAQLLLDTFEEKFTAEMRQRAQQLGLTIDEVMIFASMVEREAKFAEDRPKVAGVLFNRLDIGMAFQIDATIQYPMGTVRCSNLIGQECDWWPKVFDTDYDSPYNTYQHPELPPTPICNPGLAAIEAVLNPAEHDYLYYLSEDDGTTHFSETVEGHNDKVNRYLR